MTGRSAVSDSALEPELDRELDRVLDLAGPDLRSLRGASIALTGATGVIGRWLLETLIRSDDRLDLGLRLTIVVRDPSRVPGHLAQSRGADICVADARRLPDLGPLDAMICGAASSGAQFGVADGHPRVLADTIVNGTRSALDAAGRHSTYPRFLLLSSGAVYGPQPPGLPLLPETWAGAPDPLDPRAAYATAKRSAESLVAIDSADALVHGVIARIFTVVGPFQPTDRHFAVGNLLGDALADRPVTLRGDGRPVRSYLHLGDVVIWLLALLIRGRAGTAYNVGSDVPVSLAQLAHEVADLREPCLPVRIGTGSEVGGAGSRYVPDTSLARLELALPAPLDRSDALLRTFAWLLQR